MIKALQAACKNNNGFAKLTLSVSVHRNKPVLWAPPDVVEIEQDEATRAKYNLLMLSPKRVADYKFTSTTAAALMAMNEEG